MRELRALKNKEIPLEIFDSVRKSSIRQWVSQKKRREKGAGANQLPSRGWSLGAGDSGLGEGPTGYTSAGQTAVLSLKTQP